MRRKIVKQGAATMTISLPAKWIKKFNLKEGDELEIEELGNTISLKTEGISSSKIEINAEEYGGFTKGDLSHFYIAGYDSIIVTFKDTKVLENIKERIPDCIGYEIIDQSSNSVEIKSVSSALDEEFDNILRKVFIILKQMGEDLYNSLKNKEFDKLTQIKEMESINNKFTSFLLRILNKKGYKKPNRVLQAYDMIQNLERLADEYKYICDSFQDNKTKLNPEALKLLKEVNDYYVLLYQTFYKFSPQNKKQLQTIHKELSKKLNKLKPDTLTNHINALIEKIRNTSGSYLAMEI